MLKFVSVPYFCICLFELLVWYVIRFCSFGMLSSNCANSGYRSSCYHFESLFFNWLSINVVSLCDPGLLTWLTWHVNMVKKGHCTLIVYFSADEHHKYIMIRLGLYAQPRFSYTVKIVNQRGVSWSISFYFN